MNDLERMIIAISIGIGIVAVVGSVFLLWLPRAPAPVRDRIVARVTKWNEVTMAVLDRGAYPWAVVMSVTIGLMLIGAVANIFVAR